MRCPDRDSIGFWGNGIDNSADVFRNEEYGKDEE